ncbi:hypothetical protein ACVBGC_00805 [Burkholderia stagnalis]
MGFSVDGTGLFDACFDRGAVDRGSVIGRQGRGVAIDERYRAASPHGIEVGRPWSLISTMTF